MIMKYCCRNKQKRQRTEKRPGKTGKKGVGKERKTVKLNEIASVVQENERGLWQKYSENHSYEISLS